MAQCPQCNSEVEGLVSIEAGMRLALQSTGMTGGVPDAVCGPCMQELSSQMSQGFKLRQEADQRNKNRVMMWKNRVHLIKQARTFMSTKSYSEAAVAYEKYLRILEMIYSLERGQLTPSVFSNSARSKEMNVIATTYWDLLRIYDTSAGYGDRMKIAAEKLALFLPFSPLYPDIVKKAEQFSRGAKNPQIVRQFLRSCKASRGPCFIATALFVDEPMAWELHVLRRYRDRVLKTSPLGRKFVFWYYRLSPPIARHLCTSPWKRRILKPILKQIAARLEKN